MPNRRFLFAASCCVLAACLAGCNTSSSSAAHAEDESMCEEVKPGTITTVNHYCAVVNNDPVNPALVREWNGQKVGFCCKGCMPRWDKMTDEQKQAALDAAIAKGKVQ